LLCIVEKFLVLGIVCRTSWDPSGADLLHVIEVPAFPAALVAVLLFAWLSPAGLMVVQGVLALLQRGHRPRVEEILDRILPIRF